MAAGPELKTRMAMTPLKPARLTTAGDMQAGGIRAARTRAAETAIAVSTEAVTIASTAADPAVSITTATGATTGTGATEAPIRAAARRGLHPLAT